MRLYQEFFDEDIPSVLNDADAVALRLREIAVRLEKGEAITAQLFAEKCEYDAGTARSTIKLFIVEEAP
jgi:hypothetical protein